MKRSDIKIITSEVKTDQLSHLVNGHQANFYTQESHNVPEWTILILFTVVRTIRVRKEKTAMANCSICLTFTVSSGLAGRPGNVRLASIRITVMCSTWGEVYFYTFAYDWKTILVDQVDILFFVHLCTFYTMESSFHLKGQFTQ